MVHHGAVDPGKGVPENSVPAIFMTLLENDIKAVKVYVITTSTVPFLRHDYVRGRDTEHREGSKDIKDMQSSTVSGTPLVIRVCDL